MDWQLAGNVTLVGMAVVFLSLIGLCIILYMMGAVMMRIKRTGSAKKEVPVSVTEPEEESVPQSDGEELVAVITAAVSAYEGAGVKIKSIRKKTSARREKARAAWSAEGIRDAVRGEIDL